jgi:2,3-bisphosphoglycerate-dependent phosphoglycerate mutase
MTRLVLVRHGESVSTVERRIGGPRTCGGLSPHGVEQAERLRDRWIAGPEFTPDVVIASHYPRARETAEIVVPAWPGWTAERIVIDDAFGEHDPGPQCDGMSYAEFVEVHGVRSWQGDPFDVTFPGGETLAAFQYRVGAGVRRLLDEHRDATVLIACHGGVIDAILRQCLRTSGTGGFWIDTRNTSITELSFRHPEEGDGAVAGGAEARWSGWTLHRYGDSAHLADAAR